MATAKENQKKASQKAKAKASEVVQELPKNPQEYSYRGDEILEIPASLFLTLYRANDMAIQKGTRREFPTATEWVSRATGIIVDNPKESDILEGKVTQVMSINKTFSQGNLTEVFEPWLFPDIIKAKDAMINLHSEAVNKGIASKMTDLQAEAKAKAEEQSKAAAVKATAKAEAPLKKA